jgi:hypothetical protein
MDNQSYDLNIYRNLNWQEAESLKKSTLKKMWFKINHRVKLK